MPRTKLKHKTKRISKRAMKARGAYRKLRETATEFGPKIDKVVSERLTPLLKEGETLPLPSQSLDISLRELETKVTVIDDLDKVRIELEVGRAFARKIFEEKKSSLDQRMSLISTTVIGVYGDAGRQAVPYRSIDGQTPDGSISQAETMIDSLINFSLSPKSADAESSAAVIMPPPKVSAESLRPKIGAFKEAHLSYEKEVRKILANRSECAIALEAFNVCERRTRGLLKTYLTFAGLDDLATVLTLERRGGGQGGGQGDPPTTEGEPPLAQVG